MKKYQKISCKLFKGIVPDYLLTESIQPLGKTRQEKIRISLNNSFENLKFESKIFNYKL